MRNTVRRLSIAFVLSLLDVSAEAHAFLSQAVPPVGGTVSAAPREVRLIFSEGIEPAFSRIELATTDGWPIGTGPAMVDPRDNTQLVLALPPLAPGRYRVKWRVVSIDTHPTEGDYTFEIRP